jgi:hypothetical protein
VSASIIHGMPADAYHAHPAESASKLKAIARSPSRYYAEHVAKAIERSESPAMRGGSAVHCLVLEPDAFHARYQEGPAQSRNAKAWKEAAVAARPGVTLLTPDEMASVLAMGHAIAHHPTASFLLAAVEHAEASYFWTDDETGIECRCRMDAAGSGIVEIKTTHDLTKFARTAADFAYHLSAAHYDDGFRANHGRAPEWHKYIVAESEPPYDVCVLTARENFVAGGRALQRHCLRRLALCRAEDRWPGPDDGELDLVPWADTRNGEDE